MPSRVGHIRKIYEDGHVRVTEESTGQEYFGRLVLGSGGMVMFSPVDERPVTVGDEGVRRGEKKKVEVKADAA